MTKRRKTDWRQLLRSFAVGAAIAAAMLCMIPLFPELRAFLTGPMIRDGLGVFMAYWMAALLLFGAVMLLQTVIHEAGHLVCGLLTGYRFSSFRIGSFMLYRGDEGLRFGRFSVAGTGGQCLMEPADAADPATMPYGIYLLGGVAANIAAAAAAFVASRYVSCVLGNYLLAATVMTGVLAALLNGIPMRMGGVPNDGCTVRMMGRSAEMRRMMWVQLKINALYSRGMMLRDMPDEWFRLPAEADMSNHLYAAVAGLDASRRMECRDFAGAYDRLETMRAAGDELIGLFRMEAACEQMAACVLTHRPRTEIERIFSADVERYARLYSRYMISRAVTIYIWERFVRRDSAKASETARCVRIMAGRYPVRGEAAACVELLDWIETLDDEEYGVD